MYEINLSLQLQKWGETNL